MPLPSPPSRYIIPDLPSAAELLPFLERIDANRWYSNFGPLVCAFEQEFAATMAAAHGGAPQHAFAPVTGYHGLAIGLKLLGCGAGDNVLMPALTFPACPLAAKHIGAEAVLADVDGENWTLTPTIARAVTARMKIKAVMPVALYGVPLPADAWDAFTQDTGIPVIIDAAAAVESQRYLKSGIVVHSLHALKPFGIGEGGLMVTADEALIAKAQEYANFGTRDRITYGEGENAKMSEYHAAVALAQLQRWPLIKARRQRVYDTYKRALRGTESLIALHPALDKVVVSNLMLRAHRPLAANLPDKLKQKDVYSHRTYLPPLYHHPHFAALTVASCEGRVATTTDHAAKAALMPQCEALNQTVIGLPFHAFLEEAEIVHAVRMLAESLADTKL